MLKHLFLRSVYLRHLAMYKFMCRFKAEMEANGSKQKTYIF